MKNKGIILLVLSSFIHGASFSCDCKSLDCDSLQKVSFKHADLVFLGNLVVSDTATKTYTFKILELFKGTYEEKTIVGAFSHSLCKIFPNDRGLWIVYANFINDSTITMDWCGFSRSMANPQEAPCYVNQTPPPPPPEINDNRTENEIIIGQLNHKLWLSELKFEALTDWVNELEWLRQNKDWPQ